MEAVLQQAKNNLMVAEDTETYQAHWLHSNKFPKT